MVRPHSGWFRLSFAVGFALGVVLLGRIYITYRYVAGDLALDHLAMAAGLHVSRLEERARLDRTGTEADAQNLLEAAVQEQPEQLAWLRVADQTGRVRAAAGRPPDEPLDLGAVEDIISFRQQAVTRLRSTGSGTVVVVVMPFRYRLAVDRLTPGDQETPSGVPRFMIAELGLRPEGFTNPFVALRRSLALSTLAALALMAAMVVGALRFPAYLRGRHLEQQLSLARRVQRGLLPDQPPVTAGLDVAATFEPAEQVGGDYYDVFPTRHGDVALVLGDVSGKGLPAALVMGLVHGAVRTAAEAGGAATLGESVTDLNGLLHARTSEERFVSLFWGYLNPSTRRFRYVNAGHLPPLLFRRRPSGDWETWRLDTGGPVVGLLPGVAYAQGECMLEVGDRLVLYSDGLLEATDSRDVEFGEQGVVHVVEAEPDGPVAVLCDEIVRQARAFTGQRSFRDDLTVLVVRVASAPA